MKDYISRSALMKKLVYNGREISDHTIGQIRDIVRNAPSVNAEPVVNATWNISYEEVGAFETTRTYYFGHCSNCGRRIDIACLSGLHNKKDFALVKGKALDDFPYCHCGAKMNEAVIKE